MPTTMNFTLSPALLAQLTGSGNGVYAWAFAFAGANLDPVPGQPGPPPGPPGKVTLVSDGVAQSNLTLALTDATNTTFKSGNVVVVIQENGAGNKSTFDPKVIGDVLSVGAAQTSNFRYDAIEVTLSNSSADVADLTNITQFGQPILLQVGANTRGYNVSGQTLVNDLAALESALPASAKNQLALLQDWKSFPTPPPQPLISGPRETVLTASNLPNNPLNNSSDWTAYVAAFEAIAPNVRLATYFNGVAAAAGPPPVTAVPAALLDYTVTYDGSAPGGPGFWLVPVANVSDMTNAPYSVEIPVTDLTQNIYAQTGTLSVYTSMGGSLVQTYNSFTPNNAYGDIAKYFVAGFDAGFFGGTAHASLNPKVTGTVNLNQTWNWGANYAYGAINAPAIGYNNTTSAGSYDKFAAEFYKNTNAYGYSYSDLISAGGGTNPAISVANSNGVDVSNIGVTLFALSDTPPKTGYVAPSTSYVLPPSSGYANVNYDPIPP
jgi:hypothetical protein